MGFSDESVQIKLPALEITEFRGDDVVSLTGPGLSLEAIITSQWSVALDAPAISPEFGFVVWDVALGAPAPTASIIIDSFDAHLQAPAPAIAVDIRTWNVARAALKAAAPKINVNISRTSDVSLRAPAPEIDISFGASNIIDIDLTLAAPEIAAAISRLYGDGEEKTILAVNPRNGAVAVFTNFNFDSIAVHQGKVYGVDQSGLREIAGDKDDGENIKASAKFIASDFGSLKFKRVRQLRVRGNDTGYDPFVTVYSGKSSFTGRCRFDDGLKQQGVEIAGQRDTAGDTFSVEVKSDDPLDIESIDLIYKKVR